MSIPKTYFFFCSIVNLPNNPTLTLTLHNDCKKILYILIIRQKNCVSHIYIYIYISYHILYYYYYYKSNIFFIYIYIINILNFLHSFKKNMICLGKLNPADVSFVRKKKLKIAVAGVKQRVEETLGIMQRHTLEEAAPSSVDVAREVNSNNQKVTIMNQIIRQLFLSHALKGGMRVRGGKTIVPIDLGKRHLGSEL